MNKYAAQVEDGIVVQAIVGDPEWATDCLGGVWHGTDSKVGIGWTYTDTDGFRPTQPYPSWTWGGTGWAPPVPHPDGDSFYQWDENNQSWVEVPLPEGEQP
ncbi:MAG: hypothetical protein RI826_10520 [Chlorobium phaeovibrioides]|nr:hypothetical protein [Chlorobium phaeovibrioides]